MKLTIIFSLFPLFLSSNTVFADAYNQEWTAYACETSWVVGGNTVLEDPVTESRVFKPITTTNEVSLHTNLFYAAIALFKLQCCNTDRSSALGILGKTGIVHTPKFNKFGQPDREGQYILCD